MRYLSAASLVLASCVSVTKIETESASLRAEVERARRLGAVRCAPKALAVAETSLDFVDGELAQGTAGRAAEHLSHAKEAARRAVTLAAACQAAVVPTPTVNDSDGDGIADKDDGCPKDAEDFDGFVDSDGCPDVDNDKDGLLDGVDKCPDEAGPVERVGCPFIDKDDDGVDDRQDKCLADKEDRDGFADDDGCPDPDNDSDGVVDTSDGCPAQPGPVENRGCPDKDGDGDTIVDRVDDCPEQPGIAELKGCPKKYAMVVVTAERIEIKKQIRFRTNLAKIIGAQSQAVLQDVAAAMRDAPRLKKVRIEGHTDSVGSDVANLKLSQARADAVMAELIKLGIDPGRLEAVGFGETKAMETNTTAAGRAANRRTEFHILEQ